MKLKKILEKKQEQLLNNKGAKPTVAQKAVQEELSFVKRQIKRLNKKIEIEKKKMTK